VESEQALESLRGSGCDIVQGHHLCHPVTADALTAWAMMSSAFLVEVNGWFQPSM